MFVYRRPLVSFYSPGKLHLYMTILHLASALGLLRGGNSRAMYLDARDLRLSWPLAGEQCKAVLHLSACSLPGFHSVRLDDFAAGHRSRFASHGRLWRFAPSGNRCSAGLPTYSLSRIDVSG